MDGEELARVRRQFLDSVYDPHAPHSRTHVPYRLLDAMATQARTRHLPPPRPAPGALAEDAAEIVAALAGTRHPLLRAIRDRLAPHVKGRP